MSDLTANIFLSFLVKDNIIRDENFDAILDELNDPITDGSYNVILSSQRDLTGNLTPEINLNQFNMTSERDLSSNLTNNYISSSPIINSLREFVSSSVQNFITTDITHINYKDVNNV